jgi:rhodanese-related sulfurtransferase
MLESIKKIFGIGNQVDFKSLVKSGAIVIDVRTPTEYKYGHIKNSVNIPLDSISGKHPLLNDKNKVIITCCASGMRSASAKSILSSKGFEKVYNGGSWSRLQSKIQ